MSANERVLGRWDAVAISIGIIVGVGIFRVPCEIAGYLPNGPLILFAWVLGAVISFMGASCYAELSTTFPETGGDYVYLRNAYGKLVAFLYGWTNLTIIRPGSIAAVAFLLSDYACAVLGAPASLTSPVAACAIAVFSAVNLGGMRWGRIVQNGLILAKVLALGLLIWCGFASGQGDVSRLCSFGHVQVDAHLITSLGLALIPILWTYGGWQESVFVAGEAKDARKDLPVALLNTVALVGFIYILLNAVFLYLYSAEQLSHMTLVASNVLSLLWGATGAKVLAALVVLCAGGCINGMIITSSRLTFSMFQDIPVLRFLSDADLGAGAPRKAIVLNALASAAFVVAGSFDQMLFFTGIAVWLFFAVVVSCLFVFRFRYPDIERPCPVYLYPWLPAAFMLVCVGLCTDTMLAYPAQSLVGLALVAAGIPFFYLSRAFSRDVSARSSRH